MKSRGALHAWSCSARRSVISRGPRVGGGVERVDGGAAKGRLDVPVEERQVGRDPDTERLEQLHHRLGGAAGRVELVEEEDGHAVLAELQQLQLPLLAELASADGSRD